MPRTLAVTVAASVISLATALAANAQPVTPKTSSGIQKSLAATSTVKPVVRVCQHDFWTSRRRCWTDRSRPPTVCHHIRSSSRYDCY